MSASLCNPSRISPFRYLGQKHTYQPRLPIPRQSGSLVLKRQDPLFSNKGKSSGPRNFRGRVKPPTWALPFSVGIVTCILGSAFGLYAYYRSHLEVVPITNRNRMIWYDSEFEEEIGFPVAEWMLNRKGKPLLGADDPVAKAVHGIMSRLAQVDIVQGLDIKTYILDDMEQSRASAGPGKDGGRIFITTGWLVTCRCTEDIAGVLAHEVAHIVARHIIERRTTQMVAKEIAKWFGFKGALGNDLVQSRMYELEADHIGLMIMAQAGYNPQKRLDYWETFMAKELKRLGGREPFPEYLSTHPSIENRLKFARKILPEAKEVFERAKEMQKTDMQDFTPCLISLGKKSRIYLDKVKVEADMKPEALLKRIEDRISRLEMTIVELVEGTKNGTPEGVERQTAAGSTDLLVVGNEVEVPTPK
ncbi:hypothetical protein DL98DRAFT_526073 [Cadophora sp. DSE1049]|nr:hypothetical protein DL98DRAFT_526073 [Cadophora sp. DSE1049]